VITQTQCIYTLCMLSMGQSSTRIQSIGKDEEESDSESKSLGAAGGAGGGTGAGGRWIGYGFGWHLGITRAVAFYREGPVEGLIVRLTPIIDGYN
jgi:hypothetical protein